VFYNKVQVLNRDLSIQVISHFAKVRTSEIEAKYNKKLGKTSSEVNASSNSFLELKRKGINILDALAASGLRSVRYLKEIPLVTKVTVNDIDIKAVQSAEENMIRNQVEVDRYEIVHGDACALMHSRKNGQDNFDVIDLDPYGTAVPFLDAAVQVIWNINYIYFCY